MAMQSMAVVPAVHREGAAGSCWVRRHWARAATAQPSAMANLNGSGALQLEVAVTRRRPMVMPLMAH